jgi:hypothetical protein
MNFVILESIIFLINELMNKISSLLICLAVFCSICILGFIEGVDLELRLGHSTTGKDVGETVAKANKHDSTSRSRLLDAAGDKKGTK